MLRSCSRAMSMQTIPLRTMLSRSCSIIWTGWKQCFVGAIPEQAPSPFRLKDRFRSGELPKQSPARAGLSLRGNVGGLVQISRPAVAYHQNRR